MKICRGLNQTGSIVWGLRQADGGCVEYDINAGRIGGPVVIEKLLPPVVPSKIVCVGLNYRDHAAELDMSLPEEPVLFLKPVSTLIGNGDAIVLPPQSQRVDYEAELAVVIGHRCRNVSAADAADHIFGYTCLNDVTARDLQQRDSQWTRAKSFDTFCPLGPWIETAVEDPHCLAIRAFVNGELRQQSSTANLIFNCFELVSFISGIMTLETGDVIATGTPAGIGALKTGDQVAVEIEGIGRLENEVK